MTDPMTPADLTRLRAVAEAATPGPWEWEPEGFMGCGQVWTNGPGVEGGSIAGPTGDCYPRSGYSPKEDMQHIATFDPPMVERLIDQLQTLMVRDEHYELLLQDNLRLVAERDRLREAVTALVDDWSVVLGPGSKIRYGSQIWKELRALLSDSGTPTGEDA